MKAALFNTLHDGKLVAIQGMVSGDIELSIVCNYLRERIHVPGTTFLVKLRKCRRFEFNTDHDEFPKNADLREIGNKGLDILSSEEVGGLVVVYCGNGELLMDFESASVWLNEKTEISFNDLERVAESYWADWEARKI
jgi:hypothetical protein